MHIIIAPDQHESLQAAPPLMFNIRWTRLLLVFFVIIALMAGGLYFSARHIAGKWLQEGAPIAKTIAQEIQKQQNESRRQLWEDNAEILKEQIAQLRAETISLQSQGAMLASRLGLPQEDFLPSISHECPADAPATPASPASTTSTTSEDSKKTSAASTTAFPIDDTVDTLAKLVGVTDSYTHLSNTKRRYDVLLQHGAETLISYSTVPMVRPVSGKSWLSSRFGTRRDPLTGRRAFHAGYDYAAKRGTPVLAGATGRVTYAGRLGNYGKAIRIAHGQDISTLYGHLRAIHVASGDYVERGQLIGEVGNTGRSTGPHLHYEVRRNNRPRPVAGAINKLRKARGVPKEWDNY
ncbi:MAG: M23 family metallopeptidase [Gammaproteobacteria bacterium WSBS_2016_MAG_OTU1]